MRQETKLGIAVGLAYVAFIVAFMVCFAMLANEIGATAERYVECRDDTGRAPDVCLAEAFR